MGKTLLKISAAVLILVSCEAENKQEIPETKTYVTLDGVARLLSEIPLGIEQMQEVHDAVSSSSGNGYDEEYTMSDLFSDPGAGVGDAQTKAAGMPVPDRSYSTPLRDMIRQHLDKASTKATGGEVLDVEAYLAALESSDIQIYWPYCDGWSEEDTPVITFDPENGSTSNIGYRLVVNKDGSRSVEEIVVDEALARKTPVWVVNRNDDSSFTSLEMLRRQHPDWGSGGEITIGPAGRSFNEGAIEAATAPATEGGKLRTLILKDFTMKRNYDPWFAGASEFFVKCGSVEDFTASTEAELKLYNPSITDFMISVKRREVNVPRPFNAVLVSDWSEQLENCAFMIVEDDGGAQTTWKASAVVKVNSKSYGFEISLPFRTNDDIVWRGQLSRSYFERYSDVTGHFGDVDLTFQIVE